MGVFSIFHFSIISLTVFVAFLTKYFYFDILLNPESYPLVMIGILSGRNNFIQREIIRQTWLQDIQDLDEEISYKFIIGQPCPHPEDFVVEYSCDEIQYKKDVSTLVMIPALKLIERKSDPTLSNGGTSLSFLVNTPIIITHVGLLSTCYHNDELRLIFINDASDSVITESIVTSDIGHKHEEFVYYPIGNFHLPRSFEGSIEIWDSEDLLCNVKEWEMSEDAFANGPITVYKHFGDRFNLSLKIPVVNFLYKISDEGNLREEYRDRRYQSWTRSVTETNSRLLKEQKEFNDLLITPVIDVYRNVSHKLMHFYQFAFIHKPEFVLKIDDDSYLNVAKMVAELREKLGNRSRFWWGNFRVNWVVNLTGKWRERAYRTSSYPPFACGSGYMFDAKILEYLAKNSENLYHFQGEDVSMGIWLASIHPELVHDERWRCDSSCREEALVVGQLTAEKMREIHHRKTSGGSLCRH